MELTHSELSQLRSGIRIMALSALRELDLAEEVAQESLTRLVGALREGRLREQQSLGAFARSIARHIIVDTLRARRRTTPLGPEHEPSTEDDALTALLTREQIAQLRTALERLSGPDRELLHLSYFEGLQPHQLASRLGEPSARIRKRKERALERLRGAFRGASGHDRGPLPTKRAEPGAALPRPESVR